MFLFTCAADMYFISLELYIATSKAILDNLSLGNISKKREVLE